MSAAPCTQYPCTSVIAPPPIVIPPLGVTSIGTISDSWNSNYLTALKVTTGPQGGKVTTLSAYVGAMLDIATNRSYELGIYTDVGGKPGVFVAKSVRGTLTPSAWNALTVPAMPLLAPNTTYYLVYNTNGRTAPVNDLLYVTGPLGVGAWSSSSVPFGTWPAVFPASTLYTASLSIYATLTP